MKVLTVKQPWAWLIMHGGKDVENRTWKTDVRGRVAIHASARYEASEKLAAFDLIRTRMKDQQLLYSLRGIPCTTGAIVGTVEIVDCVVGWPSPWFVGPYGFLLRNPIALPKHIKVRGQLGWWEYPLEPALTGGPA